MSLTPTMPDLAPEQEINGQSQSYETTDGQPYAADFSNLSADRVAELKSVCTAMDQRDEWARMIELIRVTLRRYFYIGQQHPYWNADAGQMQIGPAGSSPIEEEAESNEEYFEEEFNIYTANAKIFMAVFSQNAAPSRMEPDKPRNGKSVRAAKEAEKYVEVYQKYNPPKVAQMEVSRLMWTDGRIVAVTDYEADEEKCGVDEDGEPQGAEFTEYYGVLESKVPIVGCFKKWPYCKISKELDLTVAQDENPRVADKIEQAKGSVPNNEIARMSRIAVDEGIAQVSSDTLAHLVTEDRWWLRKSAFRTLSKDKQAFWIGDRDKGIEGLAEKGFYAKFIGQIFCEGKQVSMDAQVKCMQAMPGSGNARPSYSDAMIPIQMEFNDAMGMVSEMYHKCIPHTLLDTDASSLAAITEQISRYGEFGAFQPTNGRPIAESIFQEAQIDVPASMPAWIQNLQGPLAQFITGNQPALFGANMDDQKTAAAYAQARDMSLGLMAIAWVPYLEFAAGIRWQAARLAAKRDQDRIAAVIPQKENKTKVIDIDVDVLGGGGFICSPVTDQNFPESYTARQNKWIGLFQAAPQNPIAMQLFLEPDNLVAFKDASGLDLVIKGAAARDKQLMEWEEMQAEGGPIADLAATEEKQQAKQQEAQKALDQLAPGEQAPQLPPEPTVLKSSVPIQLADDDIEEARTCVRILNDPKTQEMRTTEEEVVKDLELHLVAHLTHAQESGIVLPPDLMGIIPPPAMPMPGAPMPGAPGAPGSPALPGAPAPGGAAKPPTKSPAAAALPTLLPPMSAPAPGAVNA